MAVTPALVLQILLTVMTPVFIVIAVGFMIRRFTSIEAHSLSDIILYAFTPCLVFTLITQSSLGSGAWVGIAFITIATALVMMGVSWSIGKALGLGRKSMSAIILSTSLVNTGNYGLPVSLLAFGEKGLELAVVYFVVSSVLSYTLGVLIASHGTQGLKESLRSVTRLPHIYAVLAAFAVKLLGVGVPQPALQAVNLMGQAAIPAMLVVLGMELAQSALLRSDSVNWALVGLSSALRLFFPIIPVVLLSSLIGLGGLARNATLVQACMPTAVLSVIFTVKFKGDSQFVTSVIILSTLASAVTLTLLLSFIS
jgi:hypothetical protein